MQIIFMVYLQIFAGFWKQTLFLGADALLHLFVTGRKTKIGSRPAYIVDVSFKIRIPDDLFGFS